MSSETSTTTITVEEILSKLPPKHKVILHNDNVTPFNYVITVLQTIFGYNPQDAEDLAMQVHNAGQGVAGVFDINVAKVKVLQVQGFNKDFEQTLEVTHEPE